MRRFLHAMLLTAALSMLSACSTADQPAQGTEPTIVATTAPLRSANGTILAVGKVVPVTSVNLNFELQGTVAEVFVKEGDSVQAGEPLARLDTRDLELRIEQAQVQLDQAKADHARLLEGAKPDQIAAAKADIKRAEDNLAAIQGTVSSDDVDAAQADLAAAEARLAELLAGPKAPDIASARAAVDQSSANLQAQRDTLSKAKLDAELKLAIAANTLRDAQDAYSTIVWKNRQAEKDPGPLDQEQQDAEAAALRAVENAETAVEQAKLVYELAQQTERNGIAAAEAQLRDTQARYDKLVAPADASLINAARSQVAAARDRLSTLAGPQRQGDISTAQAGVVAAQARLSDLTRPPTEAIIESSLARINGAKAGLKQAQLAVEKSILKAPLTGTVVDLNLKVGEIPNPTLAMAVIADISQWQIETNDLDELSVVQIREGDPVTVTFDALPGFELPGRVSAIKPVGQSSQSSVTYTVIVIPDTWDERLRWNMTASVQIVGD